MSHIVTNALTPWACLKHPDRDLFYWVHSKCACSFYKNLLRQLGWIDCTTLDIKWGTSKVFSHIRDPRKKHRTGIIEFFYHHGYTAVLKKNYDDDNFWQMLARVSYLDWHSLTVWEHLNHNIDHVHWIPIDIDRVNHVDSTLDFIDYTGDRNALKKLTKLNVSVGFKKKCVDRLSQIDLDPLLIKYFEKDQQLYDKICRPKDFEPDQYHQKLKNLMSIGIDQIAAEKILDQQVKDGSYLNWSS